MSGPGAARTTAEIDKLIAEWEVLRAEYEHRGSTGLVDFINAEIRKLKAERAMAVMPPLQPKSQA